MCLDEITSSYKVRKYMYRGEGREGILFYLGPEVAKWSCVFSTPVVISVTAPDGQKEP